MRISVASLIPIFLWYCKYYFRCLATESSNSPLEISPELNANTWRFIFADNFWYLASWWGASPRLLWIIFVSVKESSVLSANNSLNIFGWLNVTELLRALLKPSAPLFERGISARTRAWMFHNGMGYKQSSLKRVSWKFVVTKIKYGDRPHKWAALPFLQKFVAIVCLWFHCFLLKSAGFEIRVDWKSNQTWRMVLVHQFLKCMGMGAWVT